MSRSQPTGDAALRRRIDAAVKRLAAARRTFTEEEALAEVWEAGYNVSPQDDPRFILGPEADGRNPRHWHLTGQVFANDRLIESLEAGTWDGRGLDAELSRLDREHGGHHVFYAADGRLAVHPDGRVELADDERDQALPDEVRTSLDGLADRLLERWRAGGAIPWTARQVTENLAELGWERARGTWLLVRAWLRSWSAVARVGWDYWVPAEVIPSGPARTRLAVIRVRAGEPLPPNGGEQEEGAAPPTRVEYTDSNAIPTEPTSAPPGHTTQWTTTLRTVNLLEGFITVPAEVQSAYPPTPRGGGRWEVIRGQWFETGEPLWVWLDRERSLLCGPDLVDRLGWREAGERFVITWAAECLVFRPAGIDAEVQREETRLADAEALATLRGGLGESYRQSVAAILADQSVGLAFRNLMIAMRERQSHDVHRGTLRAILHAGGFVYRDGRWQVGQDDRHSRRLLREAVVRADSDHPPSELQHYSLRSHLISVASSVAARCRALQNELRGPDTAAPAHGQNKPG
jgi:hypothetical protein